MSEELDDAIDELVDAPESESDLAGLEDEIEVSDAQRIEELESLLAERTEDLQRVQAEYINYKKRVDRDRAMARQLGIEQVIRDLVPVFDSIVAADLQGDLDGGFKLTADELTKVAKGYGFERFGEVGEEFDPQFHEALMQQPVEGEGEMSLLQILQVGYRLNDQVVRPARVIVAVPSGEVKPSSDEGGESE